MEITEDEFKHLCDDIDIGGISRELSSHQEVYKIVEFIASNQKSLPIVVAQVNKYLTTPEYRNKGFQVLHIILKHLPLSLAEEKAITWSNFAVEFNRVDANSERFFVLAKLVQICSNNKNADFNRHVTTGGLLKRIIDKCLSLQSLLKSGLSIHYSLIHLLNVCVQNYPGSCGNYKVHIEAFLMKYLETPNKDGVIEEAGACLHYLQQTGPAGPNQNNYANNWRHQLKKICSTIHNFYNYLFDDYIEFCDIDRSEIEGYKFEHMSSGDSLNTAMLNGRRLKGLIKFLEEMLRNPYPVEKQIQSNIILGVIQNGLSITLNDENKYMIDNYNSHWILQMKLDLLQVLKHWINIIGRQSALFQPIIFDILVNSMKNIENPSTLYSEYHLKLYNVFAFYISRAKPAISQKYHEQIITHFIKFVTPVKSNVELNIDVSLVGKLTKGKKRTIDQRIIESGNYFKNQQEADADKETREKVCIGALKALNKLFESVHVKISEETCKNIFFTIISILNDLHESCPEKPYNEENCQVELYNFLLKLYDQPFLPYHLSLSLGIMYFTCAKNRNNENVKIIETCEKAIYILEKTCQPMCGSLYEPGRYFGAENDEDNNNKRNRVKRHEPTDLDQFSAYEQFNASIHNPCHNSIKGQSEENNENQTEIDRNEDIRMQDNDEESYTTISKSKFNAVEDSFNDLYSTIVDSPTFSTFSSCVSKPSASSSNKVNILTETIILSPDQKSISKNDCIEAKVKLSLQEADMLIHTIQDKELFKNPVKLSPTEYTSRNLSMSETNVEEMLVESIDDELDDAHSMFSKESHLNPLSSKLDELDEEIPDNLTVEEMMYAFVPETNF